METLEVVEDSPEQAMVARDSDGNMYRCFGMRRMTEKEFAQLQEMEEIDLRQFDESFYDGDYYGADYLKVNGEWWMFI